MPVISVVIAAVVGVLVLAVILTAIVLIAQWRSEQRWSARHFPLIVPTYRATDWKPEPFETEVPVTRASLIADVAAPASGVRESSVVRPQKGARRSNGYPDDRSSNEHPDDEPAPAETMRFTRPVEEVLQLLPGRLEVLAGETRHREIRFVRAPGQPAQLILGRDAAGSPQHVALQSSTVSRRHARLAYADGHWAVWNLSQTNPVVVNDEELSGLERERPLVDGDRIELGEVVLRFHAH